MTQPLEQPWERILDWLHANASATASHISPARPDVEAALAGFPTTLPDEVATWWKLSDGTGQAELIPPFFAGMSIQDSLRAYKRLRNTLDSRDEPCIAGDHSGTFLQEFIPIAASGGGDFLFVDLRPGAATGCVRRWSRDEGSLTPTLWPSMPHMLADIANALETGQPALRQHAADAASQFFTVATYQAEERDGTLTWVPN